MSGNKKEDEMICALTAEEQTALRVGLGALADTTPPREVWHRIREQAEAEGLLQSRGIMQRRSSWYIPGSLACRAGHEVSASVCRTAWRQPSANTGSGGSLSPGRSTGASPGSSHQPTDRAPGCAATSSRTTLGCLARFPSYHAAPDATSRRRARVTAT